MTNFGDPAIFKTAVDGAFEHILITDKEGKILYANKAAEELTGYSIKEMKGNTPALWGGLMSEEYYKRMWQKLAQEKMPFVGELTNRRKSGEKYYAEVRIAPVRDTNGAVSLYVGVERDITKEKQISQMKSEVISLVSHQLRTPLGQLRAYLSNMQEGLVGSFSEAQQGYIDGINRSVARMVRLVSNLLNISRIERGVIEVNKQPINLKTVTDLVVSEFQKPIEAKGLRFEYEPLNCVVVGDENLLYEVLSNVVDNATKFTDKGMIQIKLEKDAEMGWIEIGDSGEGMSEEQLKSIFTKGRGTDMDGAISKGGAKLGMYLAKTLMDKQGGVITATSLLGHGSQFKIGLPLQNTTGLKNEK